MHVSRSAVLFAKAQVSLARDRQQVLRDQYYSKQQEWAMEQQTVCYNSDRCTSAKADPVNVANQQAATMANFRESCEGGT